MMNRGHVYNYADGISYPQGQSPASHSEYYGYDAPQTDTIFYSDHHQPINPIYPQDLTHFSDQTKNNLQQLRVKLIKGDPCFEYGLKHWHPNCNKKPVFQACGEEYPAHAGPDWESHDVVFTSAAAMHKSGMRQPQKDNDLMSAKTEENTAVPRPCYLCTTLDEHKKHLARSAPGLKAKPKPKPKIEFIPPMPTVKAKKTEVEEKQEVLYKITVKTGNHHNGGTSAKASIQLHGRHGKMKKRPLGKKLAVAFTFGRGTTETFYMKGPRLGEIKYITLEHDGLEQKHSWFVEWVEVMTVSTGDTWFFPCGQWLSLYLGDFQVKRNLHAEKKEVLDIDYEIVTVTADKSYAGTDANVFVTLHGKRGVSPKFPMKNKSKDLFERGMKDKFSVTTKDIGPISYIRIEHDNSGVAAGWLLEQVMLQSRDTGRTLTFPCGQWLSTTDGDKQLFKVLYPAQGSKSSKALGRSNDGTGHSGSSDEVLYEVTICTGRRNYAGTDANVLVTMFGKLGQTRELQFADDDGKKYEKGSRDVFKIRAENVGEIKKLEVRHDNKGMAAGWFLEEVIIKKFFSKPEIREKLKMLDPNHKQGDADEHIDEGPSASKFKGSVTFEEKERKNEKERKWRQDQEKKAKQERRHRKKKLDTARGIRVSDSDTDDEENERSRHWRGSSRKHKYADSEGDSSDDSPNSRHPQRKRSEKNKKKIVYNGIVQYVTCSESDEEDEKIHGSGRRRSRKSQKDKDSDSESGGKYHSKKNRRNRKQDSDSDSDDSSNTSDSDSDDPYRPTTVRKSKHQRREKETYRRDSSDERLTEKSRKPHKSSTKYTVDVNPNQVTTKWKSDRIPLCDEFTFPCHRWLAEDEDDGKIQRTLKVNSMTTFYRLPNES